VFDEPPSEATAAANQGQVPEIVELSKLKGLIG